jgi:hypothetical protein
MLYMKLPSCSQIQNVNISTQTLLGVLFLLAVLSGQNVSAHGCGKETFAETVSKISSATLASPPNGHGAPEKSEKSLRELAEGPQTEIAQLAMDAARSMVVIKDAKDQEGRVLSNFGSKFRGPGFFAISACHVITAGHIPNDGEVKLVNGRQKFVSKMESPNKYEVSMEVGLGNNQPRNLVKGKVLFSGSSPNTAISDFSVIRTDSKVSGVRPMRLTVPKKGQLVGKRFLCVGTPADRQKNPNVPEVFADIGVGLKDSPELAEAMGGVPTSCRGYPGYSGGPALAEMDIPDENGKFNGTKGWRLVGLGSKFSEHSAIANTKVEVNGEEGLRIFSFEEFGDAIKYKILQDLRENPCK